MKSTGYSVRSPARAAFAKSGLAAGTAACFSAQGGVEIGGANLQMAANRRTRGIASARVDIRKDSLAPDPSIAADRITDATLPGPLAAARTEKTGLTGWTTRLPAGVTVVPTVVVS